MREIIINKEIFKQYDTNYYVSADGKVYSKYSKKILKPNLTSDGYLRVDIHQKHMTIHKLVYLTWIGELEKGVQINHKDDNKLNNHYTNLYAGTQKENIRDCIQNKHRVGNVFALTVLDKQINEILTFIPSSKFIEYSGHKCSNGSVSKMFNKNWFKKRYEILSFNKINNLQELQGSETMGDECSPVH